MTPAALIATLREHGATVEMNGDKLRIVAPHGVLTPELVAELRRNKPILRYCLAGERPSLSEYAAIVTQSALSNPNELPPVPCWNFGEPEHGQAWGHWWESLVLQRKATQT